MNAPQTTTVTPTTRALPPSAFRSTKRLAKARSMCSTTARLIRKRALSLLRKWVFAHRVRIRLLEMVKLQLCHNHPLYLALASVRLSVFRISEGDIHAVKPIIFRLFCDILCTVQYPILGLNQLLLVCGRYRKVGGTPKKRYPDSFFDDDD